VRGLHRGKRGKAGELRGGLLRPERGLYQTEREEGYRILPTGLRAGNGNEKMGT